MIETLTPFAEILAAFVAVIFLPTMIPVGYLVIGSWLERRTTARPLINFGAYASLALVVIVLMFGAAIVAAPHAKRFPPFDHWSAVEVGAVVLAYQFLFILVVGMVQLALTKLPQQTAEARRE